MNDLSSVVRGCGGDGITYWERPDFTQALTKMFRMGGRRKKVAERVQAAQGRIGSALGPFAGLAVTNNGESRIRHCIKYDLGDGHRLVTVQHRKMCIFCFVGDHEDVDRWLTTHSGLTFAIGPDNDLVATARSDGHPIAREPSQSPRMLLTMLPADRQNELLEGVPPAVIGQVASLDASTSSDRLKGLLAAIDDVERRTLVYDVLCLLTAGDESGAIRRLDIAQARLKSLDDVSEEDLLEVQDGAELRRIVIGSEAHRAWMNQLARNAPFMEWLLFMHPEQKALVDADFSGPAQLSGVSGSGKTCIAVRRAVRLASGATGRVLLLTLNRSLAGMLATLADHAAPDTETRGRVEVLSFFELCQRLLADFEPQNGRLYGETAWKLEDHVDEVFREYYRCWNNNSDADILWRVHRSMTARGISSENYIREEFDWIRTALSPIDRDRYLTIERAGRRLSLGGQEQRRDVLVGLDTWERKMRAVGVIDYLGLTMAVLRHIDRISPQYDHIIVDEAQDFGTTELRVVRALAAKAANDLFLCGDIAQHVLPKHRVLAHAGIDVSGRTRTIRRNYRNSREILTAAYHVLIENLDESQIDNADLEILDPEYANRSSPQPVVLAAPSLADEIRYARSFIEDHLERRPHDRCCIAFAGYSLREVEQFGASLGIQTLSGSAAAEGGLVFSDLEQTKGYEFNIMVIVNCSDAMLPPRNAPPEEAFRHGCRLYVAMTRARDELYLSYTSTPSGWLIKASQALSFFEWKDVMSLNDSLPTVEPVRLAETQEERPAASLDLTGRQFLYTTAAQGLSAEAQNKILELVDGTSAIRSGRRIKWKTMEALRHDLDLSPQTRNMLGPKVSQEVRDLLSTMI